MSAAMFGGKRTFVVAAADVHNGGRREGLLCQASGVIRSSLGLVSTVSVPRWPSG